ncbi:cytochrome P450 [Cristinia sonorae]|uniref:Cytochrome P450 n=1 Tax=Cristinia sonorae TaxID=1940300 RepID=A0A8K0XTP4_9AGAR|nr:cytochrome P450 [Cristinia sonorae]
MGDTEPQTAYILVGLVVIFATATWFSSQSRKLNHIPSLTTDLPILSLIGVFRCLFQSNDLIQQGYEKYKGAAFRIPELFRWHVLVSGKTMVDELRKANDDELNFMDAMNDLMHMDYTFGPDTHHNPYHISVIRTSLTRNLGVLYRDVRDELVTATREFIPPSDDWVPVRAFETIMKIVCRTSNRIFVGLPLCRDPEFMEMNMKFTMEVVKAGYMVGAVPEVFRSMVAKFTPMEKIKRRAEEILRPVIEERLRMIEEYGEDWPDKPVIGFSSLEVATSLTDVRQNDMVSWLIDLAPRGKETVPSVALRVLTVNFAAIHTSTMTFSNVLYHLAASPEYQVELREEVDRVVAEHGWSKEALGKMIKVDSFIKETGRFEGLGALSLTRKAVKDFTFSDGTFIPKGTIVSATSRATHFDDENYENAEMFDPWRFARMEKTDSADTAALRNQFVNARPEILTFGLGKHACPGRFFASTELKSLLANFVVAYDMKFEKEGVLPSPTWVTTSVVPNRSAIVMFRRRQV